MSERILQALMQLFAIGAAIERQTKQSREAVEQFLRQQISLNRIPEYLAMYDKFNLQYEGGEDPTQSRKKLSGSSVKMLRICTEINKELNTKQKVIVFLRLSEFMHSSQEDITSEEKEFLDTVGNVFTIEQEEYSLCLALTAPHLHTTSLDSLLTLFVSAEKPVHIKNAHHMLLADLDQSIVFIYMERAQVFFMRYTGQDKITVNGQQIDNQKTTVINPGSVIRSSRSQPLYFSNLIRNYIHTPEVESFTFTVENLDHTFPNGKKGLNNISFETDSGTLVGIMGGSGAGKSTLLNILNGSNKPSSGNILVNGVNLFEKKELFEGLVGNIPQDDLLIEELTVWQNLYYNTKLCFGNLSEVDITKKVFDVLDSLGLKEIKDLRVGNVLNKTISGGQRKRLNIGLELVREPSILFVDEPTSGLSSRDAENVMDLLKQLAMNGKLVFVVIHQPSSDIFRMFDQLLMLDVGGYPVYFGNPSDAMIYFKRQIHLTDAEESECPVCGNINPEQIFNILELHEVDEFGKKTESRRITPVEWNTLYQKDRKELSKTQKSVFTPPRFRKAKPFKQFKIFFIRDFKARLSNKQYMLINMCEAPLLALILGFILRYSNGGEYKLNINPNLPAYLFIGVIVSLFLGLSVSAEEIIRDRKIQQREKFLHLSRSGYLFSKVCLLFLISAIQTTFFVLIGNWIMGIHDMNWVYWIILFSTSCFANLLGLNISAGLDSAITVYILIPFLLIPQILLSGVIVRFEKLHPAITQEEGVPLIGNIMTSRWAYESLAVEQFSNNPFEKIFFETDAVMSRATYKKDWWIPSMRERLDKCLHLFINKANADSFEVPLTVINNGFNEESKLHQGNPFHLPLNLEKQTLTDATVRQGIASLDSLREFYIDQFNAASEQKELLISKMTDTPQKTALFNHLRERYENESLEELVRSSNQRDRLVVTNKKIIQRFEPIYHYNAAEGFFKAPLFSSVKNFSGKPYRTLPANLVVIWMMTVGLYVLLYFDVLRRILRMK